MPGIPVLKPREVIAILGGLLNPGCENLSQVYFHVSFNPTARLNTGAPGCESTRSATK